MNSTDTAETTTAGCRRATSPSAPPHSAAALDRPMFQKPAQVARQIRRRGISSLRLLRHRLQNDRLEIPRRPSVNPPRHHRLVARNPPQQFQPVAPGYRGLERQELVSVAPSE